MEKVVVTGNTTVTLRHKTVLTEAVVDALMGKLAGAPFAEIAAETGVDGEVVALALSRFIRLSAQVKNAAGVEFAYPSQPIEELKRRALAFFELPPGHYEAWEKAQRELDEAWNPSHLSPEPTPQDRADKKK